VTYGLDDVSVSFGGRDVLRGLTIDVAAGTVTAVVGGDGAGKSTALRCLVGLVAPSAGIVARPPKRQIGFMPATSGTWRELTVAENVAFVGRTYGLAPADLAARCADLLARAGLSDVADRLAGQLSGGMRHKLGFCLAMLHEPSLLVLDEPTTGVDVISRVQLWRLIAAAAARGAAVLMATTYLDEAERASRVVVLDDGVPLMSGDPRALVDARRGAVMRVAAPIAGIPTWRRGTTYRALRPPPGTPGAQPFALDLEDVVIAAMLDRRGGAAVP
jgi:ABC-2 type transport system ATP-binding protein